MPNSHCKKCVIVLPSSIPRHCRYVTLHEWSVQHNLYLIKYNRIQCERNVCISYNFIELGFYSIYKKILCIICLNDKKLQFKLISFTFIRSHHKTHPSTSLKCPYLSEFSTSEDLAGTKINISLRYIHFFQFFKLMWQWAICFKFPKDQGKAIKIVCIWW